MGDRALYEREVRGLAAEAQQRIDAGESLEQVARWAVGARNALKVKHRATDDPVIVRILEARNLAKYGDRVGPDAEWLLRRYGNWQDVLSAACRHATIRDA